jgi:hypothetical protein
MGTAEGRRQWCVVSSHGNAGTVSSPLSFVWISFNFNLNKRKRLYTRIGVELAASHITSTPAHSTNPSSNPNTLIERKSKPVEGLPMDQHKALRLRKKKGTTNASRPLLKITYATPKSLKLLLALLLLALPCCHGRSATLRSPP